MKRYRGKELQDRYDDIERFCKLAPKGRCMICWSDREVSETDVVIGDRLTEKETGTLTINGMMRMRLCARHWTLLFKMSEDGGVPVKMI